jgi:hypothetical protein
MLTFIGWSIAVLIIGQLALELAVIITIALLARDILGIAAKLLLSAIMAVPYRAIGGSIVKRSKRVVTSILSKSKRTKDYLMAKYKAQKLTHNADSILKLLYASEIEIVRVLYSASKLGHIRKVNNAVSGEKPNFISVTGENTEACMLTSSNMVAKTAIRVIDWLEDNKYTKSEVLLALEKLQTAYAETPESERYSRFAYSYKARVDSGQPKALNVKTLLIELQIIAPVKIFESVPGKVGASVPASADSVVFKGSKANYTVNGLTVTYDAWNITDKGYKFRTTDKRVKTTSKGYEWVGKTFSASDGTVYRVIEVFYSGLHLLCEIVSHAPNTSVAGKVMPYTDKAQVTADSQDLAAQVKDLAQGLAQTQLMLVNVLKANGIDMPS